MLAQLSSCQRYGTISFEPIAKLIVLGSKTNSKDIINVKK